MVHALEEIQRLLKPHGELVDIHPVPHVLSIDAIRKGEVVYSEAKRMNYVEDVLHAEAALREVVERGLYYVESSEQFEYFTYADSAAELRQHWEETGAYDESPKDEAILAESMAQYARFEEVLSEAGEGVEIATHERARATRMRSMK